MYPLLFVEVQQRHFFFKLIANNIFIAQSAGALEYIDCFPAEEVTPPHNECPVCDSK